MTALAAAIALIAAAPGPELLPTERMDLQLHEYFAGELAESYAWVGLGAAGLAVSIPLFASNHSFERPMAVPVLGFALVQLALGIGLWVRTPGQVRRLSAQLHDDPAAFVAAERLRMRAVNRGFALYRIIELGLLFSAAGGIAGTGWVNHDDGWIGVGLGVVVECLAFLVLDYFADDRAALYESRLLGFPPR